MTDFQYSKYKLSQRYNVDTNQPEQFGDAFINDVESIDMSNFTVVHSGFDTLEQKYHGYFNQNNLDQWLMHRIYTEQLVMKMNLDEEIYLDERKFKLTKAPLKSGYRFMLRSKSGITVFFADLYTTDWRSKGTAKIRFSPQFIKEHGDKNVSKISDHLAAILFVQFEYAGVSADMCNDVQGWRPQNDFLELIRTQSRVKRSFDSIGSQEGHIELTLDASDIAVRYDLSESFLIGKKGSSQLACYNKLKEAKKTRKLGWWLSVYEENLLFDPDQDVFRIESRLPSNVLKNLGTIEGENLQILSIDQVIEHANSLWVYSLYKLFRYQFRDTTQVHPVWQYIAEHGITENQTNQFFYKRVVNKVKTDDPGHNITMGLAHLATGFAKEGYSVHQAEVEIRKLTYFEVINHYYKQKGIRQQQWLGEWLNKYKEKLEYYSPITVNEWATVPGYDDSGRFEHGQIPF